MQVQRSPSDAFPASDYGSNAGRLAGLEGRQGWLEDYMRDIDRRLKKLGG
jgi:hypothetical protein